MRHGAIMRSMNTTEVRHLCGHLPLTETAETPTTFCIKCVACGCTTVNCQGHMRMPEAKS
jgi:hypothetical protein